ncbi:hypothetical protein DMC47_16915 [Nostoc sp. 3335mG]|nr:hypothetical protein DMC47_16915 [Nostoc sp. 3335mG]
MIGDVNAMYVTRFDAGVTADQVVKAARLELDRKFYDRYKSRRYSRLIGNNPYTAFFMNDRNASGIVLVCHVQGTPD